jgi:MFS family permease
VRASRPAVAATLLIAFSGSLPMMLTGALGVQLRAELGFGTAALGLVVSVYSVAAAATASVVGGLVDRFGWRRTLLVAAYVVTASLMGTALLADAWWILVVCIGLGGAGHAIGIPSGNLAIVDEVPIHRRGLLFGLRQAGVPAAMAMAGLSVPLIALTIGWRWAYLLAVVGPVAAALFVTRARPRVAVVSKPPQPRFMNPGLAFGLFMLVSFIGAMLANSSAAFLVSSLVEDGVSEASAGFVLMLGSGVGLMARVGSGFLADHRGGSAGLPLIAAMLSIGAVGFLLLSTGHPVAAILGVILAFGGATGWFGLSHLVAVTHNPTRPGAASGMMLTGGFAGGAIGPALFGVAAEQWSFSVAWLAAGATTLVAVGLVLVSHRMFASQHAGLRS